MKSVLPAKTTRFISTLCAGIRRLNAAPARKAPMIGSSLAKWERYEQPHTTTRTKRNCAPPASATFSKNQRVTRGIPSHVSATRAAMPPPMPNQKAGPSVTPRCRSAITASTSSASVSVRIVAPTVTATGSVRARPSRLAMG